MYEAPAPLPEDERPRRSRWALVRYGCFWLLSVGLIVWGGFKPGFGVGPFFYPYEAVAVFCAITAVDTAALYWILGLRSVQLRAGLLVPLGVWAFLGFGIGQTTDVSGDLPAFGSWSPLLLVVVIMQLVVVLPELFERHQ